MILGPKEMKTPEFKKANTNSYRSIAKAKLAFASSNYYNKRKGTSPRVTVFKATASLLPLQCKLRKGRLRGFSSAVL